MTSHAHAFPDFFRLLRDRLPDRFVRAPRKLTPAQLLGVLCLMTGFGRKGYRRVVTELRGGLCRAFDWPALSLVPSPQAIGQARRSLSRAVCDEAFAAVCDHCPAMAARPVASYGSYRLLAIDGTRLSLPPAPALLAAFGTPANGHGPAAAPMAGLVQVWDVGRNGPVAFALTPCDHSERHEAITLFDRIRPSDLLIGDRGYPGYEFFRAICRRRARFLIRMPVRAGTLIADVVAGDQDDTVVALRSLNGQGQQRPGTPTIPVRLLRITLPDGKTEVLATNLWRSRGHDRETLGRLYTQRWRIETAFREMKVFHALEQFSATYPDGIYQEITAIQIFLLLTSELEAIARRETAQRQAAATPAPMQTAPVTDPTMPLQVTPLRFNRLIVADNVIQLMRHAALGGRRAVAQAMPDIIDFLWKNRSYAKPGRSFPRVRKRSRGHFTRAGA